MTRMFTHSGGSIVGPSGFMDDADVTYLLTVLTDEFHAALRVRHVTRERRHELATMVDEINTARDDQADWMRAGVSI